ncbi:MFS transporter [Pseudomonas sp. Pseusp122]|uniref:MFS transporter n=1 Tax=unclassified Pseudomonas TaxID=196821 RepID=UPI0039A5E08A
MINNDYTIAWSLYAFAALGCLWVWFKLTGWMWRYVKEPLRVIGLVLLFTPTIVDPAREQYAPALAISAMDLALKVGSNVWRAASDLLMYGMFAFGLYLLFVLIRWPIEKSRKARQPQPVVEQPAGETDSDVDADDEPFARPAARKSSPAVNASRARVEPRL